MLWEQSMVKICMEAALLSNGLNLKEIVAIVTVIGMVETATVIEDAEDVVANAMNVANEDISPEIVDTDAAQVETESIEIEAVIEAVTEAEIADEAVTDVILAVIRDVIQEATQEAHPVVIQSTRDTQDVTEEIAVRLSEIADLHMKKDREPDLQSVPEEEIADLQGAVDHQKTVALMLVSRQEMAEQTVARQEVAIVDPQATEKTVLMAIPMDIQMEAWKWTTVITNKKHPLAYFFDLFWSFRIQIICFYATKAEFSYKFLFWLFFFF